MCRHTVDVKAIRAGLGLSQQDFALRFGFSLAAVRDWEQRRRQPDPAARVLLTVIAHEPAAVDQALAKASPRHGGRARPRLSRPSCSYAARPTGGHGGGR